VDEFPLTPNGKVDRKSLSKLRKLAMSGNSQNALPTTEVEMELTSIWKELLGVGQVGIHDEFFRLGGNSLKAIQLIGRIHKKFGKLLTMGDVFSNATIQKLGNLLEVTNQAMLEAVTPVPQAASYELSHAQKRLWIVSQFEENQVAYNISCKILVNEELDSDSLIFAFNESVARHEILRTIFVSEEGEPRQKVMAAEQVGFKVNYMDICHIANEQKEAIIQEEEVEKPFVLSEGPLLRISLFKLSDSRYCILCSTHHIISDGWSMNILLNDVLKIYRARVEGAPNPLSPLTIQYKDIAHWQNRQLTADKINELRNFWLQYFSGNLPVLVLPLDKRRPSTPSFNGNTIDFTIPADLARLLQKTAKDASTTIFSALVALVNTLLYRYSGQKDIVIGIPFGGRDRKEFENQIGFYINTLALRSELNAQTKFADFLDATKANMLAIFKHASYPFDLLVEDLKIKPQPGRSPLFDVMVQVQDTHEVILQEQNASVFRESAISTKLNSSKFDLTFNFTLLENSEQMEGSIEYNTDLFGLATIETMRDNFLHMASMALTDPSLVLSRANLLAKDIRTETLNSFVQSL
jgi:acyl carrier protein